MELYVVNKIRLNILSCPNAMHGEFGLLSPGKMSSHSTALPSFFGLFFPCVQCFRVSVINRTLTWTTGSLTCLRDNSYACAYTHGGLGTPTTSQHTIFTRKKPLSQMFLVLRTGFEPLVFGSRVDALPIEPPRHPR